MFYRPKMPNRFEINAMRGVLHNAILAMFVTRFWIPGSPYFKFLACVEKIGETGDEASLCYTCITLS